MIFKTNASGAADQRVDRRRQDRNREGVAELNAAFYRRLRRSCSSGGMVRFFTDGVNLHLPRMLGLTRDNCCSGL
jgi:hypothetical protein